MDRKDFEHVFKDNYQQMYRLAMSILADEDESHDVVHDVFEHLLESRLVVLPTSLASLLLTSVRNRCLNIVKHKTVRERFEQLYTLSLGFVGHTGIYRRRSKRVSVGVRKSLNRTAKGSQSQAQRDSLALQNRLFFKERLLKPAFSVTQYIINKLR